MKRKVLYVVHNHPSVAPGGSEVYALELYRAMQKTADIDPILLARTGHPHHDPTALHSGTVLSAVDHDPHQYLFFTDIGTFDSLMLTPSVLIADARGKIPTTRFYREFLEAYRPDLVHFQHTLFLGIDILLETRMTLPRAPIVYTLHEYVPICHRNGQMLTTDNNEPCLEATPQRCHRCFPDISVQKFFLRKRFIEAHLKNVDLFLAPSRFLLERYLAWGLPAKKVRFEEYGRLPAQPELPVDRPVRNRFGFFGQLNQFKGINVLLEAMQLLSGRHEATRSAPGWPSARGSVDERPMLSVHGANLPLAPSDFQAKFRALLESSSTNVSFVGAYDRAQLPRLMADVDWVVVPSIWWENSPLVIQEAFAHGRPVICSDIGAMREKVQDGINGLHFRANDSRSLAETIQRAASSPGLWDTLHQATTPAHPMEAHVAKLRQYYNELFERIES